MRQRLRADKRTGFAFQHVEIVIEVEHLLDDWAQDGIPIYRRYAIVDEAMLKESASTLAAFHADEKNGTRKVVSVRRRRPQ